MKESLIPILDLKNVAIVPLPQYESLIKAIGRYKAEVAQEKAKSFNARKDYIKRLEHIKNIVYSFDREKEIEQFIKELQDIDTLLYLDIETAKGTVTTKGGEDET